MTYIAYTGKNTTLNFGIAIDPELNPIEIIWEVGDLAPYVRIDALQMKIDGNLTDYTLIGEIFTFTIELKDDPLFNAKSRLYTFTL